MKKIVLYLAVIIAVFFSQVAYAQPVSGDVTFRGDATIGNESAGAFAAGSGESGFESNRRGGYGSAFGSVSTSVFSSGLQNSPYVSGSANVNSFGGLVGKGEVFTNGSAEAGSWLTHNTVGLEISGGSIASSGYGGSERGWGPEVSGNANTFSSTGADTRNLDGVFFGTHANTGANFTGEVRDPFSAGSGVMTSTLPGGGGTFGSAEFNSTGPNSSSGNLNISGNVFTNPDGGVSVSSFSHAGASAE